MTIQRIDSIKEFGGFLNRYTHESVVLNCEMTFSVYLPPQAEEGKVPALYWLSGLTCTDDNVRTKAGAQRYAAKHGIALIFPDTSPRGDDVADEADRYDLGKGAGFYVNATQEPWSTHYQMYDYIVNELPSLVEAHFPVTAKKAISGHSMGGHGALIIGLKNQAVYQSISAFSPICNPVNSPWGKKAFSHYLGKNQQDWLAYDATDLIKEGTTQPILVDQGEADQFLEEQLKPQLLVDAAKKSKVDLNVRMQAGYDHSYFFISSFIDDHLEFHAKHLRI